MAAQNLVRATILVKVQFVQPNQIWNTPKANPNLITE
jgi:hypothetical protein